MTPGNVYGCSEFFKFASSRKFDFLKILKSRKKHNDILELFLFLLFLFKRIRSVYFKYLSRIPLFLLPKYEICIFMIYWYVRVFSGHAMQDNKIDNFTNLLLFQFVLGKMFQKLTGHILTALNLQTSSWQGA